MIVETTPPTIIAEGTRLQGTFIFLSASQVYGTVQGTLESQTLEPMHVGKTGWVLGDILSDGPVWVEGKVDGQIRSQTRVRLSSSAVVRGKITAPQIEVQAGAYLEGEITMNGAASQPLKQAA